VLRQHADILNLRHLGTESPNEPGGLAPHLLCHSPVLHDHQESALEDARHIGPVDPSWGDYLPPEFIRSLLRSGVP
jgi:hypothetical protein